MIYLVIFFIVLLIIIIFCFIDLVNKKYKSKNMPYKKSDDLIKESNIGGRGVFCKNGYKKGDIIEVCPCIKSNLNEVKGEIKNYLFKYDENVSLLAFGYCSMYNHSDNPNIHYIVFEDKLVLEATRDILPDEEMFITYGSQWWDSRKDLNKK
jgi:SET domain-containing protein